MIIRLFLRDCFPTARLPTARFFGWYLGGTTFNLNLSGQFLRAVRKLRVRSVEKTSPTEQKKGILRAVGVVGRENILRWNNTLKPCRDQKDTKDESVSKLVQ